MRASRSCGRRVSGALLGLALAGLTACDPVKRGDEAWEAGETQAAADAWLEAGELDVVHQQRLARALYKLERPEESAALLDGVAGPDRTGEGHLVAGMLALDAGHIDVALAAFEEGLSVEPLPELGSNVCTARLLLELDPLKACQRAVELAPTDPAAYLGLAEAATAAGLTDVVTEAIYAAQKHAGEPPDPTVATWLAAAWGEIGQFEQACQWAKRGGLSPTDVLSTGRWCAAAGHYQMAFEMLEPLVEDEAAADQRLPAAAMLLTMTVDEASSHQEGARRELAVARARRWVRVFEGVEAPSVGVRTDLGRLARLEGNTDEAEQWWRSAITAAPGEPAPRINLSRSLEARKALDEAREALEHSQSTPLDALALGIERARLEMRAGELEVAMEVARSVLGGCDEVGSRECSATASYLLARMTAAEEPVSALELLERAVTAGGDAFVQAATREPDLEPLRELVRYHEIMGFPNP